jgi:hypothetical protein
MDDGRCRSLEVAVEERRVVLKLASQPVPVTVAHGRPGVAEVAGSASLSDTRRVEEAPVAVPALVERHARDACSLPGLVSRGTGVARRERRIAGETALAIGCRQPDLQVKVLSCFVTTDRGTDGQDSGYLVRATVGDDSYSWRLDRS